MSAIKVLRVLVAIVFVVVTCVFTLFYIDAKRNIDRTYPSIEIEQEMLEVNIGVTDEELLQGVTAYDGKDGDLTSKVIVESVSQFVRDGECIVTYAVADSNNRVAKNTRMIKYKNYVPPKFTMERSLVFYKDESVDVRSIVGAQDMLDGDISHKIVVNSTDYTDNAVGVFNMSLQATNSFGDIIYIDLPVYVEESMQFSPVIKLSEYIIYIKKGTEPDFKSYISAVTESHGAIMDEEVKITTDFNPHVPGTYSVHYYVSNKSGYQGHSILTVVVEE